MKRSPRSWLRSSISSKQSIIGSDFTRPSATGHRSSLKLRFRHHYFLNFLCHFRGALQPLGHKEGSLACQRSPAACEEQGGAYPMMVLLLVQWQPGQSVASQFLRPNKACPSSCNITSSTACCDVTRESIVIVTLPSEFLEEVPRTPPVGVPKITLTFWDPAVAWYVYWFTTIPEALPVALASLTFCHSAKALLTPPCCVPLAPLILTVSFEFCGKASEEP